MVRAIDWARYDRLKAQGRSERDIADALACPARPCGTRSRNARGHPHQCRNQGSQSTPV
jgi:hypothetical protein